MKRIAGLLAALLCLLVFNGSLAHAEEGELLTVYVAKKIITMEPSWPEGRAIAVRDGRIVSIGRSLKDLAPWLDRYPHRIDTTFRNKILMPGFVEPHLHPLLGALILPSVFATPDDWTLPRGPSPGVRSKQAFLERVSQNHELLEDPAEWLFVFGYNLASHGEVTRADLNAISPARPIAILSRSTHVTILNDEAIEIAEITAELVQASGHGHDIDFAKGWFAEKGNMLFALPRLRPYLLSPERMTKGLEILKGLLHANGVTTLHEPGSGILSGGHPEVELEMISGVLDRDDTPFRTWLTPEASMIAARLGGAEQALAYIEGLAGKGRGRIKFTHKKMKMLVDGSYVDQLAEYDFPGYIDGHQGLPITSYADLERVGRVFWNAGYDLHVHTQGDAAARKTVDLLASLQAQKPRLDGGFVFEHLNTGSPETVRRAARLGADLSALIWPLQSVGEQFEQSVLGVDRLHQAFPLRTALREGMTLALHSDIPVSPPQPLLLAWQAVNRRGPSGRVLGEHETLTVDQALRAITIGPARILRMQDDVGSLRAGKMANFVVLEQDPYAVHPRRLKDIKIWGTVFEGKLFPVK